MGALNSLRYGMVYSAVANGTLRMGRRATINRMHNFILLSDPFGMAVKTRWEGPEKVMDALPMISVLILLFATVLISEIIKLKKEVRKLAKKTKHLNNDIKALKEKSSKK